MDPDQANNHQKIEDILDVCLQDLQSGQVRPQTILERYPEHAEELRPALEAADWLSQRVEQFEHLPGFIPSSRFQLVDRIHREQANNTGLLAQRNTGFWDRFLLLFASRKLSHAIALAIAILVIFSASAWGITLAAGNSLPGQPLYPVKRGSEAVQLALTLREDRDAQLYLLYAQRRLEEIEQLATRGDFQYIQETVRQYEENVHRATAALQALTGIDAGRAGSLAAILGQVLEKQKALVQVLARLAPEIVIKEFQKAASIAETDLMKAAAILSPLFIQISSVSPTATQTPGLPATTATSPTNPAVGLHTPTPPPGGTTPDAAVSSTPGATSASPPPKSTQTAASTPEPSTRISPTEMPPTPILPVETTQPPIEETDEPDDKPVSTPEPTNRPKPSKKPEPPDPKPPVDRPTRPPKPGSAFLPFQKIIAYPS
jgi:hypothetical protein